MPLSTIESAKETGLVQANVIGRPLLLVQITPISGTTVYLTTTPDLGGQTKTYNGHVYQARLLSNPIDQIQALSPQGYDIPGSITLEIADGDFSIWRNNANQDGWRGATITVLFLLNDLPSASYTTNSYKWTFIADKPNIDSTGRLTVAGQARQSMTRMNVPNVARQNRCAFAGYFPSTAAQRLAALTDPTNPAYGCGYSPDLISINGVGNATTPNLTNPDGSQLTDASGYYVMCDGTRSCGPSKSNVHQGCMARLGNYSGTRAADGDIFLDQGGRRTGHFTGDTYIAPVGWSGKQYTNPSAGKIYGFNTPNPADGTRYYPIVYGTQWVDPEVLAPFGDPNSDRAECIVCMAPYAPASILKVLVNGVEIGRDNSDVLFTYRLLSEGGRTGAINTDADYNGQGDPHGSTCWIEVVVPTQLVQAGSIPKVEVLVQGPQCLHALPIASFAPDGSGNTVLSLPSGVTNIDVDTTVVANIRGASGMPDGAYTFLSTSAGTLTIGAAYGSFTGTGGAVFYVPTNRADTAMIESPVTLPGGVVVGRAAANPVWALMDLLTMWGPFTASDFDVLTWYNAAQICAVQIGYTDINGNSATHARYRCSFALTNNNRMSLAKAVISLRNCAGIILTRNPSTGLLQCFIEQTLADQQPAAIAGSNYNTGVASVTALGAAATGYLAYLFDGNGSIKKNSFKTGGRSLNDTPNTVSFPFQDAANAWVKDSITVVDPDGYTSSGNQEIAAPFDILGIENYDQGLRRANVEHAKNLYANTRIDAGGGELISFKSTVKAAHLANMLGAICGIRYDQLGL